MGVRLGLRQAGGLLFFKNFIWCNEAPPLPSTVGHPFTAGPPARSPSGDTTRWICLPYSRQLVQSGLKENQLDVSIYALECLKRSFTETMPNNQNVPVWRFLTVHEMLSGFSKQFILIKHYTTISQKNIYTLKVLMSGVHFHPTFFLEIR